MTDDQNRCHPNSCGITSLTKEVAELRGVFNTWAKAADGKLHEILEDQRGLRNEVHNVMTEMTVLQSRDTQRAKRISIESQRLRGIEKRLRISEDTGVHEMAKLQGIAEARKTTRKRLTIAATVIGAIVGVTSLVFAAIKLAGCY